MPTAPWRTPGSTCYRWNAWCSRPESRRLSPLDSPSNCLPATRHRCAPAAASALKHSLTVNSGTIDPGYRGEIRVIMFNLGKADYTVEAGDRIAQLVVARYEAIEWEEGDLGDSTRGQGGFGSSGR